MTTNNTVSLALRASLAVLLTAVLGSSIALAQTSITRVSSFSYNAQGLLVQEVIEPDSAQVCLTTTHDYDGYGNKRSVSTAACAGASGATLASASTPRAASTSYTADGRFPVLTTNALGHSEAKQYDSRFGLPTSLTGPNGLTTTWAYDGFGRKSRETRSDGTWSGWSYLYCTDAGANCPASILAQGAGSSAVSPPVAQIPVWVITEQSCSAASSSTCTPIAPDKRQYHDSLNRVIRVQTQGFDGGVSAAAGGAAATPTPTLVQDTEYNSLGQIRRKSNTYDQASPSTAIWVTYSYDSLGRLTKEEAPDAAASSSGGIANTFIAYNGLSSTITNSKGQGKTTTKDALGRTSSVTDTQGNIVSYQYDALGQLIQTDAAGNITRIQYNIRGQKIRMDDPAMGVWEYAYNAFGELVSQTDSLGQSSSIEYDKLGRMTKRNEPDLTSVWFYDNCAKGVGKLCQASTLTGTGATDYNRVHSYDSQGRPSATSTKLDTTVTTSVSYEAATGRVLSKTYPTGYQVSYTYTQLGFLKSVTGQGATNTQAGYTKEAKYEILQINAQGQITSYRYGNQVITNKTFDAQTGRLQTITATKEGLATGGIQQTSYSYDSLSNLTARGDVNSGVQESFGYDNLNRLTNYQAVGGSVTSQDASSNVQVMYDARGNITYKSDVGRYWYDPQRPNRLTNITLETPAGALPLTGTRALAYAFDDYKLGARTLASGMGAASGAIMGNGNLWYTVSQDNTTGRHSVRWETYTSFNMPKELALVNLGGAQTSTAATQSGATCPAGATQVGSDCITPANTAIPASMTYSCPAGYSVTGSNCTKTTTVASVYAPSNTCLAGDTVMGSVCRKPNTAGSAACKAYAVANGLVGIRYFSTSATAGDCEYRKFERCSAGSTSWATSSWNSTACYTVASQAATPTGYSCPSGTTPAGATCIQSQTQTVAITPIYSCPSGSTLSGNRCYADSLTSSQVANRTLTFTYGPEHQRIAQRTQLDATAPASMSASAGIVYYLNGQNNDLGYEKEVKANGLIEHKHYLSAGGMVFAMQVTRTGNTATGGVSGTAKPQQSLQYLHQDHLGSVAVVTDHDGSVLERLAYDPWGKRRFPNGTADQQDSIVGLTLDRGFTIHEHLDEMGVIHMNGRIYDPLIGRFMSADPFIPDASNLQAHNRFAYVYNNPLKFTDPDGFKPFWKKKWFKKLFAIAVGYFTGGLVNNLMGLTNWAAAGTYSATQIAVTSGAVGGLTTGLISSGGDLKAGLLGAFSGGLFGGIGAIGKAAEWTSGQFVAAHAAAGCITSVAGGGGCGSGAISAAFGKFTTQQTQDWGAGVAQFTAATIAGGVGSVIGGGKFESGAVTAAFGYLFNNCLSVAECEFGSYLKNAWNESVQAMGGALSKAYGIWAEASLTVMGGAVLGPASAEIAITRFAATIPEVGFSAGARFEAKNLAEQMAMDAARGGAGRPIMGTMNDHRLTLGTWEKYQYVVYDSAKNVMANVHYIRERATGIMKDFKFK
jgi:RHS repeat-associated protein